MRAPYGVILAGGAGRRLARTVSAPAKAAVELAGRPLLAYPAAAVAETCERLAIVCKRDTSLPELDLAAERWNEPDEPRHPLTGIIHALERADAPVLVLAADMPFVTAEACRKLRQAAGVDRSRVQPAAAVAVRPDGALEPLAGVYPPAVLAELRRATPGAPLRETVAALEPRRVELPAQVLRSVNTPDELSAARVELESRRGAATQVRRGEP